MNNQDNSIGKELESLFKEFTNALQSNDLSKASVAMNGLWVFFQIIATSSSTELKELTYLKAPFTFDNGGKYILLFTHIDGPKIKLQEDSSGQVYTSKFEEIK